MNIIKKMTFLLVLMFTFLVKNVYASEEYDYKIENYNVNISVNEDSSMDITEKIDTYFYEPKHGIYRKIPLKNQLIYADGEVSKNHAKIINLSVNDKYTLSLDKTYETIVIGNSKEKITGEKEYVIKYKYTLSKSKTDNYDEFYFNIIGTEWDTFINNVTFNITMPKSFDESKLSFARGYFGSTASSNISYIVKGNSISGFYNGTLNQNEGITIRLELPKGYFDDEGIELPNTYFLMFLIPIIGVFVTYLFWRKYGVDDPVIETIEENLPEDVNPLELKQLYDGCIYEKDVSSLLFYLANKGYIKITKEKPESEEFEISKLKDYDGNNETERIFLNGLFEYKEKNKETKKFEIKTRDSVTSKELKNNFYKTTRQIMKIVNSKKNKAKVFERNSISKYIIPTVFIFVSALCLVLIPTIDYVGNNDILMSVIKISFYLPFVVVGVMFHNIIMDVIWLSIITVNYHFMPPTLPIDCIITYDIRYLVAFIFGIICIFAMGIILSYMSKRTEYGNLMLGKINGFKKYLETVDEDKINQMVSENPTYLYDLLAFAIVLDVSDTWINKFKKVNLNPPYWYETYGPFNVHNLNSFTKSTIKTSTISMGSSSSGGSSSGVSGGGSGGGGGGSW